MARPSRTGGKAGAAKTRKASPLKGRKTTKTKRRIAPAAARVGRRSVSGPSKDLKEAREQQAATAEILKVIASSPNDVQPVFDAIATSARRLCGGHTSIVTQVIGDLLDLRASSADSEAGAEELRAAFPLPISASRVHGRAALNGEIAFRYDTENEPDVTPIMKKTARARGYRSLLVVPMMREGVAIGTIGVSRREAGRFTDKFIELLCTFADQAVIAIGNVRLLEEVQARTRDLTESLQQQTATSEVLRVISSSSGELQPVFKVMLDNALKICEASYGNMLLSSGDGLEAAELHNSPPAFAELFKRGPLVPPPGTALGRVIATKKVVHIPDILAESGGKQTPLRAVTAKSMRARTLLAVPMLRESELVGVIVIYRQEVRPFSEKQIELVTNFADQAVIAIENVRLFNETKESLERQTATAEILKVIASSPSDVQPVFDAIASGTKRLLSGFGVAVFRLVDGKVHLAAYTPTNPAADEALRADFPVPVEDFEAFRLAQHGKPFPIPDTEEVSHAPVREIARLHGFRSMLWVPMMNGDVTIGIISVTRREPGAFAPYHVQLLQTFADQAVIAIENARLFKEVQAKTADLTESLQQQTATADVLKVISRSAFDLNSVMDTLTSSAAELCKAEVSALYLREGDVLVARGVAHADAAQVDFLRRTPLQIDDSTYIGRTFQAAAVCNIADVATETETGQLKRFGEVLGFRSIVFVPLMRESRNVGIFALARMRTGQFSQREVELVQTFADQAVIAIENVRLFSETQEALERQTATAEVLQVISSSPGDLKPVFDQMLAKAMRLCEAQCGFIYQMEQGAMRAVAEIGVPPAFAEYRRNNLHTGGAATPADVMRATRKPAHVHDARDSEPYRNGNPNAVAGVDLGGARTILYVPMIRNDDIVGVINVYRQEVRPFTEEQISLLENFASQAVIAIENARLFNETQEALERQTATADILKVIASSPSDEQPVFEAIAHSAKRLIGGFSTAVHRVIDDIDYLAAFTPTNPESDEVLKAAFPRHRSELPAIIGLVESGETAQIADSEAADEKIRKLARARGWRSATYTPLMNQGTFIGFIVCTRLETGMLADHHVQLLRTFADQAVIAIENARLFNETKEALEQQTATSEVLEIISSSPGELDPVFQKMLENACRVCEAHFGVMHLLEDDSVVVAADYNLPIAYRNSREGLQVYPHPESGLATVIRTHEISHMTDLREGRAYRAGAPHALKLADVAGARTILVVPMLKEAELIGTMTIFRQEVRPFTDKQIALVENFTKQAVIAIENTRLLKELRMRTQELSQSLDDLRAAQDRLVQTEKLASLGQLTAGIAHEIKNPLNFVNNFSALSAELTDELNDTLKPVAMDGMVRKEVDELTGMLKDNLEKVVQHGKRADSIVKNMLLHSREGSGEHRLADINAIVDESLNLAYHGARAEKPNFNVTMQRSFDPAVGTADIYPQEITRVLLNLISNGFYATAKRKTEAGDGFEPTVTATTKDLGDNIEIRIRDNGTGIPDEVKVKIFNPFFTTKPAGEGTGLGLSMSHDIIVKQHGGKIDVETEPGQFTEFRIVLPRTNNFTNK